MLPMGPQAVNLDFWQNIMLRGSHPKMPAPKQQMQHFQSWYYERVEQILEGAKPFWTIDVQSGHPFLEKLLAVKHLLRVWSHKTNTVIAYNILLTSQNTKLHKKTKKHPPQSKTDPQGTGWKKTILTFGYHNLGGSLFFSAAFSFQNAAEWQPKRMRWPCSRRS